jgi:hypothetical protein
MKPAAFLRGSLWLTLGLFLVTSASAQQPPPSPPVPEPAKPESPAGPRLDPKALEILKASSVRLAAARSIFSRSALPSSPRGWRR